MVSQRALVRTLGLGYVIIVVIANILGSGIYKKIAPMAAELNSSVWILLAWTAAGIITLFGALGNAEVAGMLADTGGEYVYIKKIYNRFFAFIYGWSLFTAIQSAAIASVAYVFAQSLNSLVSLPPVFPNLNDLSIGGIFFPFQEFNIKLTAILLILILTYLNISGLRLGAGVSRAIIYLVAAGLLTIVVAGLTSTGSKTLNLTSLSVTPAAAVTLSS